MTPQHLGIYRRCGREPVLAGHASSYEAGVAKVRGTDLAFYFDYSWLHNGTWSADCPLKKPLPKVAWEWKQTGYDPEKEHDRRYIHRESKGNMHWKLAIKHLGIQKRFRDLHAAMEARDKMLAGEGW